MTEFDVLTNIVVLKADVPPADVQPTDVPPADVPPANASPADASPANALPADASPENASPADASLADAPIADSPSADAPMADSSSTNSPSVDAPMADSPSTNSQSVDAPMADSSSEYVPPKVPNAKLSILVRKPDNSFLTFQIKANTPLYKLMKAYCEYVGLPEHSISLRYNGKAVCGGETPMSLNLKDNDLLETYTDF